MSSHNIPLICHGHTRPVPYITHSNILKDGSFYLVSGCLDGRAMLRNGKTGDWIGTFLGHKGAVWCANVNSDCTKVITASADYTAKLWDAITGDCLITFTHKKLLKTASFSPDDETIATGGQERVLTLYRLSNLEADPVKVRLREEAQTIRCTQWSPKTGLFSLAIGDESGHIRLYDCRCKKLVRTTNMYQQVEFGPAKHLPTSLPPISSLRLSYSGDVIVATAGKLVVFFNSETFDPIKTFNMPVEVNSASRHPDGTRFVAGGADFYSHVFMSGSGKEIDTYKGHHGPVHSVSYAPDGETFCSGSEDGTIRIWQNYSKEYGLWQH